MEQIMSDWIEINIPYQAYDGDSFKKRDLNKPGVLIRLADEREFLIGHINEWRGVCDDCTEFEADEIVKAYKIVWSPEKENQ
jgi:hypothetical protein